MTVDPFIFTLLLELLAVTSVVAVGMFLLNHSRKRRDRRAAQVLVERLKEGQEQRLGENRKILTSRFGLEEKQAAELATGIDCAERRFYQTLIATYLRRDHKTLESIDTEFMGTVETYRTLTPSLGDGDNSEEIKRLREEKKRLATDLQSAMEAMGGVLNDYSSALPPGSVAGTKSDAQGASENYSAADDGIVVEEVKAPPQDDTQAEEATAEEVVPAEEATTQETSEEEAAPAEEAPTEDEAEVPEDSPAESVEEEADPPVESAAAIAAAEDIDIPDYTGLTEPDLGDKPSD